MTQRNPKHEPFTRWVTVFAAACSSTPAPTTPAAPQPLSPDVAAAIEAKLPACDAGNLEACYSVGKGLEEAKRFDDAIAIYDFGCHDLRGKATAGGNSCLVYEPNSSCDPALCSRCKEADGSEACLHYDASACASPSTECPLGNLSNCLELKSAAHCGHAAYVLGTLMPSEVTEVDLDLYCRGRYVELLESAHAYAAEACSRLEASPVAQDAEERRYHCQELANVESSLKECQRIAASRAETEARMASLRAQMLGAFQDSVAALVHDNPALVGAASAAAAFVPGGATTATTPKIFVNPTTGTQWQSIAIARLVLQIGRPIVAATVGEPAAEIVDQADTALEAQ